MASLAKWAVKDKQTMHETISTRKWNIKRDTRAHFPFTWWFDPGVDVRTRLHVVLHAGMVPAEFVNVLHNTGVPAVY